MEDSVVESYEDGQEPLVFYHDRNEYRKYEPESVRDFASGKTKMNKGFFRVLVGTRSNRMIFFAMVMTFALVFIVKILSGSPGEANISGVNCVLSALSYDDRVLVSIRMKPSSRNNNDALPRNIVAKFIVIDADGMEQNRAEIAAVFDPSKDSPQFLRDSFTDYEIRKVRCIVSCGEEAVEMVCNVEVH